MVWEYQWKNKRSTFLSRHSTFEAYSSAPSAKNIVWNHIFSKEPGWQSFMYFCRKPIFVKQLEGLSLKKQEIIFLLSRQYLHSKFSRFKIAGFKTDCTLTCNIHSSSLETSSPGIWGNIRSCATNILEGKGKPCQKCYSLWIILMNQIWSDKHRSIKITQNQPHQLLTEGQRHENSWGWFEGKEEA